MSYILNGKFYRGKAPLDKLQNKQNSTFKQYSHNQQRRDHSRDIIQPFDRAGNPNEDFIQAFPLESRDVYHFIPDNEDLKKL